MQIALKFYVIELSKYIIAFLMLMYTSLSVFCIVSRKKKPVSVCTSVQSGLLLILMFLCFLDLLDRGSILKILRNDVRKRPLIPAVRADRSRGKKIFPDLSATDIAF